MIKKLIWLKKGDPETTKNIIEADREETLENKILERLHDGTWRFSNGVLTFSLYPAKNPASKSIEIMERYHGCYKIDFKKNRTTLEKINENSGSLSGDSSKRIELCAGAASYLFRDFVHAYQQNEKHPFVRTDGGYRDFTLRVFHDSHSMDKYFLLRIDTMGGYHWNRDDVNVRMLSGFARLDGEKFILEKRVCFGYKRK